MQKASLLLVLLPAACAGGPTTPPLPPVQMPALKIPEIPATMNVVQQEVPGSGFRFKLRPIPGNPQKNLAPFWIGETEITWDAFDSFLLRLDEKGHETPSNADAISRPTKPYLPPDRGFGHEGYAAISLSFKCAKGYCEWLSAKTGKKFRLPTEAEWEHAARAESPYAYGFGDDARALATFAWFGDNSGDKPHAVGKKQPNGFGLYDMHGNVAEWCVGPDGTGVLRGGSYRQPAAELRLDSRLPDDPEWNRDDPNIPKGTWWLVNGMWIGFRIVCEKP